MGNKVKVLILAVWCRCSATKSDDKVGQQRWGWSRHQGVASHSQWPQWWPKTARGRQTPAPSWWHAGLKCWWGLSLSLVIFTNYCLTCMIRYIDLSEIGVEEPLHAVYVRSCMLDFTLIGEELIVWDSIKFIMWHCLLLSHIFVFFVMLLFILSSFMHVCVFSSLGIGLIAWKFSSSKMTYYVSSWILNPAHSLVYCYRWYIYTIQL